MREPSRLEILDHHHQQQMPSSVVDLTVVRRAKPAEKHPIFASSFSLVLSITG
jgi:hypothetical protein